MRAQLPVANFTYTVLSNGQVDFTSTSQNVGSFVLKWQFSDGTFGGNQVQISHTFPAPGYYKTILRIENASGFLYDSTTRGFTIPSSVSINEHTAQPTQVYPNPCTDRIILSTASAEKPEEIRVYGTDGRLIETHQAMSYNEEQVLSTAHFVPGFY